MFMNLTTRVIELEPGWLLVAFKGEKPSPDKRAFWLQRTLRDWLGDHPGRQVRRIVPIQDEGELLAVHVWLAAQQQAAPRKMAVKVHHQLIDQMPAEHMEALLHYAYDIFFRHEVGTGVLAVVSRGGNVVLFDHHRERCFALPLSEMQNLPADALTRIKQWQSQPGTAYFAIELGGFETP
jgi:hypothetical protein